MGLATQYESVQPDQDRSFRLLRNPNLSELFYWHFHPEYELVYIVGANGTRHVGNHISTFLHSDLVLIGSNIPHLNFDYGVKSRYQKVVLQLHPSFWKQALDNFPELHSIMQLFKRSQRGLAFSGRTKKEVGDRLLDFHEKDKFEQFLEVLSMLQVLSKSEESEELHSEPYLNSNSQKEQERLRKVYAYIESHFREKIELQEVADLSNLTKAAFCRYFKQTTGNTFTQFLNQYRISQAKRHLLMGESVSLACFESGFESLSYFNRTFKKITQENPKDFKQRHQVS